MLVVKHEVQMTETKARNIEEYRRKKNNCKACHVKRLRIMLRGAEEQFCKHCDADTMEKLPLLYFKLCPNETKNKAGPG